MKHVLRDVLHLDAI